MLIPASVRWQAPAVVALLPWLNRQNAMCLVWAGVCLPLSLADNMSKLQVCESNCIRSLLKSAVATWVAFQSLQPYQMQPISSPLTWLPRYAQCTSLFGVVSLAFLVLSVVAHALGHWASKEGFAERAPEVAPRLINASEKSLSALAIVMFAFTCQVNVPLLCAPS